MIKEILEKNIFCIKYSEIRNVIFDNIIGWNITILDTTYRMMVSSNQLELDDAQENACQQYIKDNGFKIEWICKTLSDKIKFNASKYTYQIPKCGLGIEIEFYQEYLEGTDYIIINLVDNKIIGLNNKYNSYNEELTNLFKIFAYLYANDIKIINDIQS